MGRSWQTTSKTNECTFPACRCSVLRIGYLLLAPLVVPVCVAALLTRKGRGSDGVATYSFPTRLQFVVVFIALAGYAIVRIFNGSSGVVAALSSIGTLQGDTATLLEGRIELFGTGTTAAFGIVYSALPALSHVALFKARHYGKSWRVIALTTVITTVALSIATFQIAPAAVFLATLIVSASHLRWMRMTLMKAGVYGIAFLSLLHALNAWKFGEWTIVENVLHIVLRMPAAYPYYLNYFPDTVPFLGADWVDALTGRGTDPGAPFVVARFMYPGSILDGAMAAPAHVQGYAEGDVLNSMFCIAMVGVLIAGVALLQQKSRNGAIWHALYIQGLVMLYYTTQASFRGVVWHSYGFVWSLLPLVFLGAMSLRVIAVRGTRRRMRVALWNDSWETQAAQR